MALTLSFKDGIDLPEWRPVSPFSPQGMQAFTANSIMCSDLRGAGYAHPESYCLTSTTALYKYNHVGDAWMYMINPGMSSTLNGGSEMVFAPGQGPTNTTAAGSTSTKIVLTSALPNSAYAGPNLLANRGDGKGFLVRIIGKTSGKTEERRIVANTAGTTPTLYLDSALSFTPAVGDTVEFLSGRLYIFIAGTATTGIFKYIDLLTNTPSANLSVTGLPTTLTTGSNTLLPLDETYVPYTRKPGEGFVVGASTYDTSLESYTKKCLLATSTSASTIRGQSIDGDAGVVANEYRNFQIRIVEDITNPTAVGQRRKISYHTAGTSPTYTLASNWTVTPSATCKFVIENDNDKMILFASGATTTYNYNHTANTWDTSTWATRGTVLTQGFAVQPFGLDCTLGIDPDKVMRNSQILSPRGNNTGNYDVLDISNSASTTQAPSTGAWTSGSFEFYTLTAFLTQTMQQSWQYVPRGEEGRYIYLQLSSNTTSSTAPTPVQIGRFDLYTRRLEPFSHIRTSLGNGFSSLNTTLNNKAMVYVHVDSSGTEISALYYNRPNWLTAEVWQLLITR